MQGQGSLRRVAALDIVIDGALDDFGVLPELRWVAPTDLFIDETYQRDLSRRSLALIEQIAQTFRWNRMKPPVCVEDGVLHCVDGQHTAIGAATRRVPLIPIFVVHAAELGERARAFVAHNTDRVICKPVDIYRALLAAGDEDAVDVDNVCKRAGVRIRLISRSSAVTKGDTAAIACIRKLVKRRGVIKARKILQCLVEAERKPITESEILAVERLSVEQPKTDLDELAAAIRRDGDQGLAKAHAKAKTDRAPVWRCLAARYALRLERERPIG
jgi:hypothetical protein